MLLIIAIVLILLLLIPVGIDVGYCEGDIQVKLRMWMFTVRLYPSASEKKNKEKKQNRKNTKKGFSIPDVTKDEILDGISVAVKSIKKLRFHLHKLKLHFISAFEDPYRTAMVYGYASAAFNAFALPQMKQSDVQLGVDFERENCFVDGYLSVTIKIYYIIKLMFCLLFGMIPILWQRRQRMKVKENNSVAVKGKVA